MGKHYLALLLGAPLASAAFQFLLGFKGGKDLEKTKTMSSKAAYFLQFFASLWALAQLPAQEVGFDFFHLSAYHFDFLFTINKLHLWLALMFALLFIVTEKLSFNYLHAEEEHAKFYGLKAILNFSSMAFVFSSNIDFLFFNWEVIGISSALLISYFYRRNQAVENSMFAFSVYRLCDAAFLQAALLLFYFYRTESIAIVGSGAPAALLGTLIFVAIMGKCGVYPFSSWLPLALEGPTPSSNLYYMTLSTHMGVIFLMKTSSIWESSVFAKSVMVSLCLVTVVVASTCARVQSNVKGALAWSTLAQVSLILIEVVFGLKTLAVAHMSCHMFYRLAQMAFSPSVIDRHALMEQLTPKNVLDNLNQERGTLYFWALNGFKSEKAVKAIFTLLMAPLRCLSRLESRLLSIENAPEKPREIFYGEKP